MKQLLKITFLLFPVFAGAQTVSVYVNDTTYISEPVKFISADSVNGKAQAVYVRNNAPAFEVNYYYGKRSGFVRILHPETGKLMHSVVYANGKLNGESIFYNDQGKIVIKGFYKDNKKDDFWIYKHYNFYGQYKNGLKNGVWKFMLPTGKTGKIRFKKGVLERSKKGRTVLPANVPRPILMDGVVSL
jgi:antitoxin component YwqK of YwqJK toxin-antitoxin module